MRNRRNINDTEDLEEINISPLIDMVFILLIFFIVTTVFVEETGVEVDKPSTQSASQLEKNSILLAITSKNEIVYGGSEIGLTGVRPLVKRLTATEMMPVIVQADRGAFAELLIQVIDEAKLGGAENVSVSTQKAGT